MAHPPAPPKPRTLQEVRRERRLAEEELALAETRHSAQMFAALSDIAAGSRMPGWLREAGNYVTDADDPGWVSAGASGLTDQKALSETRSPDVVRRQSYRFWRYQPHARGILRNFQRFIIGREFNVDFDDDTRGVWRDDEKTELKATDSADDPVMIDEVYADFSERNKWKARMKEIVNRTFRDADCFVRRFVDGGKVTLRFVEAERVRFRGETGSQGSLPMSGDGVQEGDLDDPALDARLRGRPTSVLAGIEFLAGDVETVVAYHVQKGPIGQPSTETERVPASEIQHFKCLGDSTDLRGIPLLEVVFKRLANYELWEDYRITLNKFRTAIALVRKVEGTAVQAQALMAGRASPKPPAKGDAREPSTPNSRREAMPPPGSIITAGPGVSWDFINPNLNARDASEDGRRILLGAAAGSGLPEMLVTGDWSNSNFASAVEARTPAVREWEDWQEFFGEGFERILRWVVRAAKGKIEGRARNSDGTLAATRTVLGTLGLPDEVSEDVTLQWGSLVARDRVKETERYQALWAAKLLSKTTWSALEDLDHDAEQKNLKQEAEEAAKNETDDTAGPAGLARAFAQPFEQPGGQPPGPGGQPPLRAGGPGSRGGAGGERPPAGPTTEALLEAIRDIQTARTQAEDQVVLEQLGEMEDRLTVALIKRGGPPTAAPVSIPTMESLVEAVLARLQRTPTEPQRVAVDVTVKAQQEAVTSDMAASNPPNAPPAARMFHQPETTTGQVPGEGKTRKTLKRLKRQVKALGDKVDDTKLTEPTRRRGSTPALEQARQAIEEALTMPETPPPPPDPIEFELERDPETRLVTRVRSKKKKGDSDA